MPIRAIRGTLAIIFLFAVFFYTLLNVVFVPIKDTGLSLVKTYHISGITLTNLLVNTEHPAWRVTYVRSRYILSFNYINVLINARIF